MEFLPGNLWNVIKMYSEIKLFQVHSIAHLEDDLCVKTTQSLLPLRNDSQWDKTPGHNLL